MPSPSDTKSITRDDLVRALAGSLGIEKATEEVSRAITSVGHHGATLDRDTTLLVLEALAKQPGLVGTVARFAKVRVILRFDQMA